MRRVGADDGAVLVVGEVGVVRLVVCVSGRGRTVLGRFRVARSAKEVGSAGETAAAAAEVTSTTASKAATSAPLWRWHRLLSCRVQPGGNAGGCTGERVQHESTINYMFRTFIGFDTAKTLF